MCESKQSEDFNQIDKIKNNQRPCPESLFLDLLHLVPCLCQRPKLHKASRLQTAGFCAEVIVLNLRGILAEATLDKQQCVQHLA